VDYDITAVSSDLIAYSAQDGFGDRLYVQRYKVHNSKPPAPPRIAVGRRVGLDVRTPTGSRFISIAYPTFSPDASQIAFVGVAPDGQQDIYTVPVKGGVARRVTNDFYSKKDLAWGADGIYCASDATDHGRTNLFRIDPATGTRTQLTTAPFTDRHPHPMPDGSVVFSSDAQGKPDLYILEKGAVRRITNFTTGLTNPSPAPKGRGVFASTFYGGDFRLVEVPKVGWTEEAPTPVVPPVGDPLPIPVADFPTVVNDYDALALKNWRPEAGFVYGGGASGGVAGRAAVLFDDLLRDYVLFIDVSVYGSFSYTQGQILFENRAHRNGYVFGAYHFVQQQTDRLDTNLAYLQRDFGLVGAIRHPLDRFRRYELELTVGGVQRYCLTDFSTTSLINAPLTLACQGFATTGPGLPYGGSTAEWQRQNGGVNPTVNPTVRFGYDTIRYDPLTGPLSGNSLLLELGGGYLPTRQAVHGFTRFDVQQYVQLIGRSNLSLRLSGATSFAPGNGKTWERSWWLTSADNLRGYYPGDIAYLIGTNYYVANLELQFPLAPVVHLLFFDYIEGVAAFDFGGVFNRYETQPLSSADILTCKTTTRHPLQCIDPGAWDSRTLTGVLGVNVLFGPLLLRVHFGHPFDIGGLATPAIILHDRWVTNITLRYFFF
jgi:hypothetical protein